MQRAFMSHLRCRAAGVNVKSLPVIGQRVLWTIQVKGSAGGTEVRADMAGAPRYCAPALHERSWSSNTCRTQHLPKAAGCEHALSVLQCDSVASQLESSGCAVCVEGS